MASILSKPDVISDGDDFDFTFTTHHPPDVTANTGIIGLCTVPESRAGPDDMGYHVADFLAFKALFRDSSSSPKAQNWLSLCDVAKLHMTETDAAASLHHERDLGEAIEASRYEVPKTGQEKVRSDHVSVEPEPSKLAAEFLQLVKKMSVIASKYNWPLVIIVCGPTNLDQDIFFGDDHFETVVKSCEIREALGDDPVRASLVTPALFSAGWQLNPSICRQAPFKPRDPKDDFLARQVGGIFAREATSEIMSERCPMIDHAKVDPEAWSSIRFPQPLRPTAAQKTAYDNLQVAIHSSLAARLVQTPKHASFSFDYETDDWERLVGQRQGWSLQQLEKSWDRYDVLMIPGETSQRLGFLGSAFGGRLSSQVGHIEGLIHRELGFPVRDTITEYEKSLEKEFIRVIDRIEMERDWAHYLFNLVEHRSTIMVLGDILRKLCKLPVPFGQRCRDWDQKQFFTVSSDVERASTQPFARMNKAVPWAMLPPGFNLDRTNKLQKPLDKCAFYVSMAIALNGTADTQPADNTELVVKLLARVKERQVELLMADSEVKKACQLWLGEMDIPVREQYA